MFGVGDDGVGDTGEFIIYGPGVLDRSVEKGSDGLRVGEITDYNFNLFSGELMPDLGPFDEGGDRVEHAHVKFGAGVAAEVVVYYGDIVAPV